VQTDQGVADERQGQQQPDLARVEARRREVQDEDDPEGAVAGHPDRSRGEQQPRVPGHGASVGWPRWPKPTLPMPPTSTPPTTSTATTITVGARRWARSTFGPGAPSRSAWRSGWWSSSR